MRTVSRKTSSAFGKAGPQLTPSRQWWTSRLMQEEGLVSVRDSARWSALTYREVEHLHRGDGAEKRSRLPVANDRWLSERQMGDMRGRQVVSQRRDEMWSPSRVKGGFTRLEHHVWRLPAHGPTCWNEHHRLRGWRICRVRRWCRQNPGSEVQWKSVAGKALVR